MDTLPPLTAAQCKARAQLLRSTADEMAREMLRQQLLRLASEYEWLAHTVERIRAA